MSLSTSCRAPGANSNTINQQTLDAARSAARAPYGILAGALLAGAAAIVGVIVNSHNARLTRDTINTTLDANDATQRRDRTTADLTRAGQFTDRYIKAIGLISDDKLNARLGGLYALEQLAREAPVTYDATIVEVLGAFIRERAPWPPLGPDASRPRGQGRVASGHREQSSAPRDQLKKVALDVQTALTILGRRNPTHNYGGGEPRPIGAYPLDLSQLNLAGVKLEGAHLKGAWLRQTHLEGADLEWAHLEGANLYQAHLQGADMDGTYLEGANLVGAHLEGARLVGTHLEGAYLTGAHLEEAGPLGAYLQGASLREAHLEGADLSGAYLEGADLSGAHLEGADLVGAHLEGADLRDTDLSQEQLAGAVVDDETVLPDHLQR